MRWPAEVIGHDDLIVSHVVTESVIEQRSVIDLVRPQRRQDTVP